MDTSPSTPTIWESGRLVARPSRPRVEFAFGRQRWIAAALLVMCAVVMTIYVAVLQREVARSAMQHDEQRARAVAEAGCEASRPAQDRGECLAILEGEQVALRHETPPNDVGERPAVLSTASLASVAGLPQ